MLHGGMRDELGGSALAIVGTRLVGRAAPAEAFPDTPVPAGEPRPHVDHRAVRRFDHVGAATTRARRTSPRTTRSGSRTTTVAGSVEVNPYSGALKRTIGRQAFTRDASGRRRGDRPGTGATATWSRSPTTARTTPCTSSRAACCSEFDAPDGLPAYDVTQRQLPGPTRSAVAARRHRRSPERPGARPTGSLYVGDGRRAALLRLRHATPWVPPSGCPTSARITGLQFSPSGADLYVSHALTKVSRVNWTTKKLVAGWTFDLSAFGVMDARAVEVFDDRLWVSDGYDFRPDGDPLAHAVFVFSVTRTRARPEPRRQPRVSRRAPRAGTTTAPPASRSSGWPAGTPARTPRGSPTATRPRAT